MTHHRCYRDRATVRYLLAGRTGVEFIDVQSVRRDVQSLGPRRLPVWHRSGQRAALLAAPFLRRAISAQS